MNTKSENLENGCYNKFNEDIYFRVINVSLCLSSTTIYYFYGLFSHSSFNIKYYFLCEHVIFSGLLRLG
jgi:hypothetical protein